MNNQDKVIDALLQLIQNQKDQIESKEYELNSLSETNEGLIHTHNTQARMIADLEVGILGLRSDNEILSNEIQLLNKKRRPTEKELDIFFEAYQTNNATPWHHVTESERKRMINAAWPERTP
jgi:predicted  nucleic acid-binding Zn-ribbon protein